MTDSDESDIDFEEQLRLEAEEQKRKTAEEIRVDPDGTVYEWDKEKEAWFPKIDDDFIAKYQMNYGVDSNTSTTTTTTPSTTPSVTDPNYYHWYYQHYYSQAGQTTTDTASSSDSKIAEPDKDSKAYQDYWNWYYKYYQGAQDTSKQQIGDKEEVSQPNEADSSETTIGDEKLAKEDGSIDPSKRQALPDNQTKDGDKEGAETAYSDYDYWSYYYYYYGYGQEGQGEKSKEKEEEKDEKGEKQGDEKESKGKKGKDSTKRKAPKEPPKWFEMDEGKNTNVYISGLPLDITDDEFQELVNKCGLVMYDPIHKKPKVKLYRDKDGKPKGDGRCCYIKMESVELAMQIIDGYVLRDHTIKVEPAKFQLKGEFDPKRRRKLTNKEKKKMKEQQQKLFDWRPDKPRGARFKYEKTIIVKNVFDPKEFEKDPVYLTELQDDMRQECSKYGEVKKVVVCDRHAEGVVKVMFKEAEEADICKEALNGRWFAKRQLVAETWDGKTKYEVEETEEEREARLKKWAEFLETEKATKEKAEQEGSSTMATATTSSAEPPADQPGTGSQALTSMETQPSPRKPDKPPDDGGASS